MQPNRGVWANDVRTPLGLVDEGEGRYTDTDFEQQPDWPRLLTGHGRETCAIGFVEVRVERRRKLQRHLDGATGRLQNLEPRVVLVVGFNKRPRR